VVNKEVTAHPYIDYFSRNAEDVKLEKSAEKVKKKVACPFASDRFISSANQLPYEQHNPH
jgi:hypothetical protein